MQCPACVTENPEEDVFCESCGSKLRAGAIAGAGTPSTSLPGCACGAAADEMDEDGFCSRCGLRVRQAGTWEHVEQSLSAAFAAVSDRGLRHDRNEDRCAIYETAGGCAIVVCDGVSATRQSEVASAAVTEGTLESLRQALQATENAGFDPAGAMRQSIADGAAKLVSQSSWADRENPPSTTVVAALVVGREAILGWLGDSRAYWIDASGARTLTRDHSWMNEAVTEGGMSADQAAASPKAHAITRWIGADSGDSVDAAVVREPLRGPGILLLCSDGLWNYVASDGEMAKLVHDACASGEDALEIARRLIQFAKDRGGADNITAAVLRLEATAEAVKVD